MACARIRVKCPQGKLVWTLLSGTTVLDAVSSFIHPNADVLLMLQRASVPLSAPIALLRDGDEVEIVLREAAQAGLPGKKTRRGKRAGKRHASAPAGAADAGKAGTDAANSRLQLPHKRRLPEDSASERPATARPAAKRMWAGHEEDAVLAADAALEATAKACCGSSGAEPAWLPVAGELSSLILSLNTSVAKHSALVPCRLRRLRLSAAMTPEVGDWEHGVIQLSQRLPQTGAAARPSAASASSASASASAGILVGDAPEAGAGASRTSASASGDSYSYSYNGRGAGAAATGAAAADGSRSVGIGTCKWIPLAPRSHGEWSALLRGAAIQEAHLSHAASDAAAPDGAGLLFCDGASAFARSSVHVDASSHPAPGMPRPSLTVCCFCFDAENEAVLLQPPAATLPAAAGCDGGISSAASSSAAASAISLDSAAADAAATEWDWGDVVEAQVLGRSRPPAAAAGSVAPASSASTQAPAAAEAPVASFAKHAASSAGYQPCSDAGLAASATHASTIRSAPAPKRSRRGSGAGMSLAGLAQQLGFGKA